MPKPPIRRVYVAGPYTSDDLDGIARNINAAADLADDLRAAGFLPYVPHSGLAGARALVVDFSGPNGESEIYLNAAPLDWDEAMEDCRDLLPRMDAVLMMPGWEQSRGATEEFNLATNRMIPVFFTVAELVAAREGVA